MQRNLYQGHVGALVIIPLRSNPMWGYVSNASMDIAACSPPQCFVRTRPQPTYGWPTVKSRCGRPMNKRPSFELLSYKKKMCFESVLTEERARRALYAHLICARPDLWLARPLLPPVAPSMSWQVLERDGVLSPFCEPLPVSRINGCPRAAFQGRLPRCAAGSDWLAIMPAVRRRRVLYSSRCAAAKRQLRWIPCALLLPRRE